MVCWYDLVYRYDIKRRHIQEDRNLNIHYLNNLKFDKMSDDKEQSK